MTIPLPQARAPVRVWGMSKKGAWHLLLRNKPADHSLVEALCGRKIRVQGRTWRYLGHLDMDLALIAICRSCTDAMLRGVAAA